MPGSTPIAVPITTPIRQYRRLLQLQRGGEAKKQIVEQIHALADLRVARPAPAAPAP